MRGQCPQVEVLAAYVEGNLAAPERSRLEAHLVACRDCRRLVARVIQSERAVPDPPSRKREKA